MSVHQKRDGRWFVRYRDKQTGKPRDVYFGRGIKSETRAREFNESLGLRPYKRRTPAPHSAFFFELVNEYAEHKSGSFSKVSLDNFLYKMKGVILPEIGHVPAIRLTRARLDQYVKKRLKSVKRTTVHRELSDVQAVLNWSVNERLIAYNPIANYKKPRRDDAEIMPPSDREIAAILANAAPHLVRALYLSYYTGLRPGAVELSGLSWSDIDFDSKTILIRSAKKGGRKARLVPIGDEFADQLAKWHADDDHDDGPIVRYRGRRVRSLKTAYKNAKTDAKIKRRLPLYAFRHAFASRVLRAGGDLKSTSELIGHSRPDTTTRIYQQIDTSMHRETIERLPPIPTKKWVQKSKQNPKDNR